VSETLTQAPGERGAPAPAPEGPAPEPRVRLPLAVLAVVATVVVALLLVALVVRLDADRLPSGPPRDPPPPDERASRMVVDGRKVTFQELSITLPDAPYTCSTTSTSPPSGFSQLLTCGASVHEDYDGKGSDWGALMGVGLVDDGLAGGGDLKGTTSDVFDRIFSLSFQADQKPRATKQSNGPAQLAAPSGSAWTQQADVRFTVPGLPTPYDRLVVIVVRLESGKVVAFFSDFPHDGGKDALQSLVASVDSFEAVR
jgi:hypothetical protein